MSASTIKDLKKQLQKKIDRTLLLDVAPVVVDRLTEHAQSDVYEKYVPQYYNRRFSLLNESNYSSAVDETGTLDVWFMGKAFPWITNRVNGKLETSFSKNRGKDLDTIIEYGGQYDFPNQDAEYDKPRPWVENAQDSINSDHNEIMKILKEKLEGKR